MGLVRSLIAPPKAASGPGVWSMMTHQPITQMSRTPQRLMHEAQQAFHANVWVNAAERVINSRLARVPYHLEREDGETVERGNATPAEQQVIDLIDRPNTSQRRASTRRGLWGLSSRHTGLCGNGFLLLDQQNVLSGVPLSLLYINPVRMTEATDDAGNLLGWVVDHPSNPITGKPGFPGLPLQLNEVEHFILDEPDEGHFGIGIAEAAHTKITLSRLADSHAAQMLSSGGRIAGLMAPKSEGSVNADQWDATIRAWRQIVDDPESAKRLHIVRGPVDFTPTAASPREMELNLISTMSRDDVLAAWNVPGSQLGIMSARGLNSGETVKYEEAALWQGPIEDRVAALREVFQRIIDRFGLGLQLMIETPSFDDEAPLYENAAKAKVIPLTVNQRLEMVGKDPLDEQVYGSLGNAIFIDQTMVRIDPEGVAQEEARKAEEREAQAERFEAVRVEPKASLEDDLRAMRERITADVTPQMQKRLLAVLAAMRKDMDERVARYRDHLAGNPFDSSVWFDEGRWQREMSEALSPVAGMATEVATAQSARFRAQAQPKADEWIQRVAEYVRLKSLSRVRGMLTTTREAVQKAITQGIRNGLPANELADLVRSSAGLDEYRAELIARTEVMQGYNDASLRTFREFGAERVIADDGDTDDECSRRNGQEFSISEADSIADHPNGTLTWIPA